MARVTTIVTTEEVTEIILTGVDIMTMLRETYPGLITHEHVKNGDELVTFRVPHGGDYSGVKINVCVADPVVVEVRVKTVKQS